MTIIVIAIICWRSTTGQAPGTRPIICINLNSSTFSKYITVYGGWGSPPPPLNVGPPLVGSLLWSSRWIRLKYDSSWAHILLSSVACPVPLLLPCSLTCPPIPVSGSASRDSDLRGLLRVDPLPSLLLYLWGSRAHQPPGFSHGPTHFKNNRLSIRASACSLQWF